MALGNALARAFHSRGLRVFGNSTENWHNHRLRCVTYEYLSLIVDNPTSVKECHKEVEKLLGGEGLDYLINNAGRSMYSSFPLYFEIII